MSIENGYEKSDHYAFETRCYRIVWKIPRRQRMRNTLVHEAYYCNYNGMLNILKRKNMEFFCFDISHEHVFQITSSRLDRDGKNWRMIGRENIWSWWQKSDSVHSYFESLDIERRGSVIQWSPILKFHWMIKTHTRVSASTRRRKNKFASRPRPSSFGNQTFVYAIHIYELSFPYLFLGSSNELFSNREGAGTLLISAAKSPAYFQHFFTRQQNFSPPLSDIFIYFFFFLKKSLKSHELFMRYGWWYVRYRVDYQRIMKSLFSP